MYKQNQMVFPIVSSYPSGRPRFQSFVIGLLLSAIFSIPFHLCGAEDKPMKAVADKAIEAPFYFIAIHNEPANAPGAMDSQYNALLKIIAKADECSIKLTLMFSSTWVDYLLDPSHPERKKRFQSWQAKGHEIAAHYHSIRHPGFWDGYSPLSEKETNKVRSRYKRNPFSEQYQGTMKDFADKLAKLDKNINSGCLNEEAYKDVLPDNFTILTGSGFANLGEVGVRKMDEMLEYGVNEYVLVGKVNGIERRWLSHSHAMKDEQVRQIKDIIGRMKGGAYGAVTHSLQDDRIDQVTPVIELMEFLHKRDPQGKLSVTVREVVEKKLLPEKRIDAAVLLKIDEPPPPPPAGPMGMDEANGMNTLIIRFNALLEECKRKGHDVSEAERFDLESRSAMQNGNPEECIKKLQEAIKLLENMKRK